MKYIRTKDGRTVELEGHFAWIDNIDKETKKIISYRLYQIEQEPYVLKEMNIEKEADTIEELCDCFIAVDKNGNLCENPMIAKGHCFKSFYNYYKANKLDVDYYLAILTDKGLTYVAKMNDDGELKLL